MKIYEWVINILIVSLPFSWYMCYLMYHELKNKDHVIKIQEEILNKIRQEENGKRKTMEDTTESVSVS